MRFRLIPVDEATKEWFTIVPPTEAALSPGESRSFEVDFQIPAATPPKAYRFRTQAVGLANPDEEFGEGPPLTVTVEPSPVPKPQGKGYIAALVGAMIAALVGGLLGTLPATLFLINAIHTPTNPNVTLGQGIADVLGTAIGAAILLALGIFVGLWVGPVIGAWIALRFRGYFGASWTAATLAILQPIWVVVVILVMNNVAKHVSGFVTALLLIAFYLISAAVPPWPARAIVVALSRRH
jgi:hypothetical protein